MQKYERGTNRIGSSRLYEIGRILAVPVAYFFEELPAAPAPSPPETAPGLAEGASAFVFDAPAGVAVPASLATDGDVDRRETLELVRAFNRIRDPQVRRRVYGLTRALAELSYRVRGSDMPRA